MKVGRAWSRPIGVWEIKLLSHETLAKVENAMACNYS